MRERRFEAFYMRLGKELTVDQRRSVITGARAEFKKEADLNPSLTPYEVEVLMMKQEVKRAATNGKWSDRWLVHPMPNSSEPRKAVCHLTDVGELDEGHLAHLYLRASLHPIDRFFMQIRRRLSLLERPIGSASNAGRTWYGYSAYQPANIEKARDTFPGPLRYLLKG